MVCDLKKTKILKKAVEIAFHFEGKMIFKKSETNTSKI
jgi:hypothetical protein